MIRIALVFLLLTRQALAAAPDEVRVGILSIFSPGQVELSGPRDSELALVLVSEDGRERKIAARNVLVRCGGRSPVLLEVEDETWEAAGLVVRPGDGVIRVGVPGKQPARPYSGWIEVRERHGRCVVIDHVPFERYVKDVACREIRGAGPEALKAQAVLARTWTLTNLRKHSDEGFDFCDLTHCQAYEGASACTAWQRKHLRAVAGKVLLDGERPADVAYFSTCGGHTARASDVWGARSERTYLAGVADGNPAYCAGSPHFRWRFEVQRDRLCAAVRKARPGLGAGACQVEVRAAGPGDWVRRVRATAAGQVGMIEMSGEDFHMLMGRAFGWGRFKSGSFAIQPRGRETIFVGRGMGHGVGMCQHGAMGMERRGADWRAILEHYFPGTRTGRIP